MADHKNGGKKKSGIAASTADYWAVEYCHNVRIVAPRLFVRALAREAYARHMRGEKMKDGREYVRNTGDNGNESVLVSIEWFARPWKVLGDEAESY